MRLDALTIANTEAKSVSGSSPMRLILDGQTATMQAVYSYLEQNGQILPPVTGEKIASWSSGNVTD